MHFFRQFRDYNSGREHGNQTNDPIFFIHQSKFIFMWISLWSILVCKIPQLWAPIRTTYHLRIIATRITFCPPRGTKKRYQLMHYKFTYFDFDLYCDCALILFDCGLPEAAVRRCSVKRVFLEISQNPQENTCARVSFLTNLQA